MKCALVFDSLEQLGQRPAATMLLFNPTGEALEISTWPGGFPRHHVHGDEEKTIRLSPRRRTANCKVSDSYFS